MSDVKLKDLIAKLYPESNLEELLDRIDDTISRYDCYKERKTENWYKSMNMYVAYPDAFGESQGDLEGLTKKLNYISELGCDALHILPLFESPMVDGGFDVSSFKQIRKSIGDNEMFDQLIKVSDDLGIEIFIDLVLNHISYRHKWFQKAVEGSDYHRDFFICSKEKPKLIKKFKNKSGPFARYNFNGKEVDIRIIFPDFVGEIPHWRQGKDGYWYYHTFYPHQIDLDWRNPQVFLAFVDILCYWASRGINFRLDAIIFLSKDVFNGKTESCKKVYLCIEALNKIMKQVAPESIFLAEAVQEISKMKKYFGKKDRGAELNYSFQIMNQMWVSLIQEDASGLFSLVEEFWKDIPTWAGWVNFIRNHDGITLEFAQKEIRHMIMSKLKKGGLYFMNGFNIAGRTFSLLEEDLPRHYLFYFLLASMPGTAAIIYGDELAKKNDFEYMTRVAESLRKENKDRLIIDARDINRGRISDEQIETKNEVYNQFKKIFQTRKNYKRFFTEPPEKLKFSEQVFSARYKLSQKTLDVIVNLGDVVDVDYQIKDGQKLLKIGKVEESQDKVKMHRNSAFWLYRK